MSRSYKPLQPASSQYLQQRWDSDRYQAHRYRVSSSLPVVDTKGIKTPAHIGLKLKKLQLQDERLADINRADHLLSSKLSEIQRSKGQLDNWNIYTHKSLNAEKRRAELQHISSQNQAIYQRITVHQSEYRRQLWLDDWERTEQRRNDITRYTKHPPCKQRPERRVTFSVGEIIDYNDNSLTTP